MDLKTYQQLLRDTIKEREMEAVPEAPFWDTLKKSRELQITYRIVVYWRRLQLQNYCRFTTQWLKKLGKLETSILELYKKHAISPFADEWSLFFLEKVAEKEGGLTASIALFERAMLQMHAGEVEQSEINWDCNPEKVLNMLLKSSEEDMEMHRGKFLTIVDKELEGGFEIYRL